VLVVTQNSAPALSGVPPDPAPPLCLDTAICIAVRSAKLAALPRGDSGRMQSMTPHLAAPAGACRSARGAFGRRARLAARGRPAAPDGPAPDLAIGFPRRSIEHASNSPRKLRAIEHASRYPPRRGPSDKAGAETIRRSPRRPHLIGRFAAAAPALTARKGAHAWECVGTGRMQAMPHMGIGGKATKAL
jgi:hypothetical protein